MRTSIRTALEDTRPGVSKYEIPRLVGGSYLPLNDARGARAQLVGCLPMECDITIHAMFPEILRRP
jgi:hypothetical protein